MISVFQALVYGQVAFKFVGRREDRKNSAGMLPQSDEPWEPFMTLRCEGSEKIRRGQQASNLPGFPDIRL
jgi:hypothetical protein